MLVPQEILDYIIDARAENQPVKEILPLRSVSRFWRPRIDFHVFRMVKMTVYEGPSFLLLIKASKFNIAKYIKFLTIAKHHNHDFNPRASDPKGFDPLSAGYSSFSDYLRDFTASFPNLYALNLVGLSPLLMEYIPRFPSIKQLSFTDTTLTSSQFLTLFRATTSLKSIGHTNSVVVRIGNGAGQHAENKAIFQEKMTTLKHYTVLFPSSSSPGSESFESFLFPVENAAKMPHMRCLVLRNIDLGDLSVAGMLLSTSIQFLQYLYLQFKRNEHLSKSGKFSVIQVSWRISSNVCLVKFRKVFDLLQCANLKYIRFDDILSYDWFYYQNITECSLIVLDSLPKGGSDITVCFSFRSGWNKNQELSRRLDQIISSNSAVKKLDIAVPYPQIDHKTIVTDLPRSFAKGILYVTPQSDLRMVKLETILKA